MIDEGGRQEPVDLEKTRQICRELPLDRGSRLEWIDERAEEVNIMGAVAFGYKCQECGQGNVSERVIRRYHTRIKGYPFVVEDAHIGVCDRCGAEHFAAQETARWESLFSAERESKYLQPDEIRHLRKSMGLSMEQFAFLIGCTRQSICNWERDRRAVPQSRMADLLMRLVRESHAKQKVDVIQFLTSEAARFGIKIDTHRRDTTPARTELRLIAMQLPRSTVDAGIRSDLKLAADTEENETIVVLLTEQGQKVGTLSYDYLTGSLEAEFSDEPTSSLADVELHFKDGTVLKSEAVRIEKQRTVLLRETNRTEDQVCEVLVFPANDQTYATGEAK